MKVKAMTTFAGKVTMIKGESKDIKKELADDLIRAKFVKELKTKKPSKESTEETDEK